MAPNKLYNIVTNVTQRELSTAANLKGEMIAMTASGTTTNFEYHNPTTIDAVFELLAQYVGNAKILAGGHSLIPTMKLGLMAPEALIDLRNIESLRGIAIDTSENSGDLLIGAMTSYYQIQTSPAVLEHAPILAEAAATVADLQVRNKGTIGGSMAHSDPAGDLPAVVLALDAQFNIADAKGSKTIRADAFFVDFLTTALGEDELLLQIRIPKQPAGTGGAYVKLPNKASHYALVGVAAVVTIEAGVCRNARIGITGAGPWARRATAAEQMLIGKPITEAAIEQAATAAADLYEGQYNDDIHASAAYRAAMVKVYTRRALTAATAKA